MNKRHVTSNFLRSLADAIDVLSNDELQVVLDAAGLKSLTTVGDSKRRFNKTVHGGTEVRAAAAALMDHLSRAVSKEEAHSYIESQRPTRAVLIETAKMRSLHVVKDDSISVIVEKLISNTVGSRLDSNAIRNG